MGKLEKVYEGDTWKLTLNTGINLDNATLMEIRVVKPSSTPEEYTALRIGTTNKIYHKFTPDELDEVGLWKFHSYIEFAGGADSYHGTLYEHFIYELGT